MLACSREELSEYGEIMYCPEVLLIQRWWRNTCSDRALTMAALVRETVVSSPTDMVRSTKFTRQLALERARINLPIQGQVLTTWDAVRCGTSQGIVADRYAERMYTVDSEGKVVSVELLDEVELFFFTRDVPRRTPVCDFVQRSFGELTWTLADSVLAECIAHNKMDYVSVEMAKLAIASSLTFANGMAFVDFCTLGRVPA